MKREFEEKVEEENDQKKLKLEKKHYKDMTPEELIDDFGINVVNILNQVHVISVKLFGSEPRYSIERNDNRRFECEVFIDKGENWDPPSLVGYGYGNSEKQSKEGACFEIIYDLLICHREEEERIKIEEERITQDILAIKKKVGIEPKFTNISSEIVGIMTKLFAQQVEFETITHEWGTEIRSRVYFGKDYKLPSLVGIGKASNSKAAKRESFVDLLYKLEENGIFDQYNEIQRKKKEKMKELTKSEDTPPTKHLNEFAYLVYKAKPHFDIDFKDDVGYEAVVSIQNCPFIGKGTGSTKDQAKNEASYNILEQMPKPKPDNPLPIDLRDKFYKKFLIDEAELIPKRYESVNPGISHTLLDDLLFRDWIPYLKLKYPVEPHLCGFDREGKRTIKMTEKQGKGYLVPAYNPDGKITGGQIFPYNFKEEVEWLSSRSDLGYPHHLPNGENPLFVWNNKNIFKWKIEYPYNIVKPEFLKDVIGLSTTKRSLWASFWCGFPSIGADRYEFHKCQKTFFEYIDNMMPNKVIKFLIFPEPEILNKKEKLVNIFKTFKLVLERGHEIKVVKFSREVEINELTKDDRINILSIADFDSKLSTESRILVYEKIQDLDEIFDKYHKITKRQIKKTVNDEKNDLKKEKD